MEDKVPGFGPPLVSIVITNFNYGRFLQDAVASVSAQTYPRIECVIVDDASTDDSPAIIEALAQRTPGLKLALHETNRGQSMAFRTGLLASRGEYVVFLDADDMLFPRFVETHIFVHLSSRRAVGFTSSDMVQSKGRHVVTSAWERMNRYIVSGRGRRSGLLRRIDACAPDVWPMTSDGFDDIESRVHFVGTTHEWEDWIYAPTSGNCFRREALELLLGDDGVEALRFHSDNYVNKGACLLCGAILIDLPLFVYRFHDRNGFIDHPELHGFHGANMSKAGRADQIAWRMLVDRLIADAAPLVAKVGLQRYAEMLATLQRASAMIPELSDVPGAESYIATKLRGVSAKEGHVDRRFLRRVIEIERRRRRRIRRVAEFFLTMGRFFHASAISALGERLWRA
ncbi:glycosyltransferase family 2 protein [Methylosinus sp. Sm6]|uniref:glycosyltransferase family 2 protein n=1 Tax=Methylosinus sp. Sm6 TaxID=2866948 RepID=UPI001C9A2284|nr:glycosyltransferase family A protein [Methylosinus sp. Sm6]MBY6239916.1 glycosyltransferase family 2 protein [Methylosinus sp. Sm6]